MTTVETMLRGILEHPKRILLVIILTCGVGLGTLWPIVDEYLILVEECARTELSIAEAQHEIEAMQEHRRMASEQAARLADLRKQTLVVEDVHKFSSELVELTREAGCQLRRVDLQDAQKRKWYEEDHPLKAPPSGTTAKESPYELRTQRVALSISGPMEGIQALLAALRTVDKLVHTQSIQIKPTTQERSEISLDLELLFFDLTKVAKKPTS